MATEYRGGYRQSPPQAGLGFVLVLVLVALAAVVLWNYWPGSRNSGRDPEAQPRPIVARGELSDLEKANIAIYKEATPSLVQITNLDVRDNFFGLNMQEVPKGVGSGFVWDDDGHIVTNYHVVQGARAARVTLSDQGKTQLEAERLWAHPDLDIAVLWLNVPKGKLKPLALGTSHDLQVGQMVFALGDPFGLNGSMSTGIVSALGREIKSVTERPIQGVIQTTAPLNPGNSGGPLLDSSGRLIGMNTAILSPTGAFAGVGFAIPVDEINRVVPQLIKHGKIVRPWFGVQLVDDQVAHELGVDTGALILKVVPGGPAAQAGLRGTSRGDDGRLILGDVILAVDGKEITGPRDVHRILAEHQPGDVVTVTVNRNGAKQDFRVTLRPSEQKI
jgi:S1-C subfamily serine protease